MPVTARDSSFGCVAEWRLRGMRRSSREAAVERCGRRLRIEASRCGADAGRAIGIAGMVDGGAMLAQWDSEARNVL